MSLVARDCNSMSDRRRPRRIKMSRARARAPKSQRVCSLFLNLVAMFTTILALFCCSSSHHLSSHCSRCPSFLGAGEEQACDELNQGCRHSPFVQRPLALMLVHIALFAGRSPADCRISRLRFAFSRLKFARMSTGVVCLADPGSGLY